MSDPNSSSTALKVYGGMSDQHAGQGNVIAQVNPYSSPSGASSAGQAGGARRRKSRKGGQGLTEIAVPALLLTANHLYGRKTASKKFGKRRFSRRRGRSFRRGGRKH